MLLRCTRCRRFDIGEDLHPRVVCSCGGPLREQPSRHYTAKDFETLRLHQARMAAFLANSRDDNPVLRDILTRGIEDIRQIIGG